MESLHFKHGSQRFWSLEDWASFVWKPIPAEARWIHVAIHLVDLFKMLPRSLLVDSHKSRNLQKSHLPPIRTVITTTRFWKLC